MNLNVIFLGMRRKSLIISLISIFAALHVILGAIPGIWRSWAILIQPLEGVILGPYGGLMAALIGSILSRFVRPRTVVMFVFGLGEPLGALVAGLTFKEKYGLVTAFYTVLLAAYFLHPLGRSLPAWCLWDAYIAYLLAVVLFFLKHTGYDLDKRIRLIASAVLGNEADVLTRIFFFIPLELYKVLGVSESALPAIWVAGAFETPVELFLTVLVITVGGVPLLAAIDGSRTIEYPVT